MRACGKASGLCLTVSVLMSSKTTMISVISQEPNVMAAVLLQSSGREEPVRVNSKLGAFVFFILTPVCVL